MVHNKLGGRNLRLNLIDLSCVKKYIWYRKKSDLIINIT